MTEGLTFYEFFAGGGMARCGLGSNWKCLFANDFNHKKSAAYRVNWKGTNFKTVDIKTLKASDLPEFAELVWGSFPCQDLSLAGGGAGLKGERSGTFYPFWDLMRGLIVEGRAPKIIALENVCGALTSHDGKDFSSICSTFNEAGYRYGALVIDAELFLPHSRPRLFFIGVHQSVEVPAHLLRVGPQSPWHPRALQTAKAAIPTKADANWIWWKLPLPENRKLTLSDLIEENPPDALWHTPAETTALVRMMSEINLAKLEAAKRLKRRVVGGIYKRTRRDESGAKVQRAEVRFDEVSGCLRTPAGGSSRQLLIVVEGERVRSRLITIRETARLMGLPDSYSLPSNYNEGYHLTGDGVAVPVVRHLSRNLFEPILVEAGAVNLVAA
jgi:DNA (cytosine-5)-methyltransferase 1